MLTVFAGQPSCDTLVTKQYLAWHEGLKTDGNTTKETTLYV